jgi:hypothetical protein
MMSALQFIELIEVQIPCWNSVNKQVETDNSSNAFDITIGLKSCVCLYVFGVRCSYGYWIQNDYKSTMFLVKGV